MFSAIEEIDEFEEYNFNISRKYWSDEGIWKIIHKYPSKIKQGFEELRKMTHLYFKDPSAAQSHSFFDYKFICHFCHTLCSEEKLIHSFAKAGGIKYQFGLEWAKMYILKYYHKYQKPPLAENGFFYFFKRDCKRGVLSQFQIKSWKDLINQALKDEEHYDDERQFLSNISGLNRIKKILQEKYKQTGKIPLSEDNGCKLIAKSIKRMKFEEFGITTWGDLIAETFGNVKGTVNLWKGAGGLKRAISAIHNYYEQYQKSPSTNEYPFNNINQLVNEKHWFKEGIQSWDDLLDRCTIPLHKRRNINKRGLWDGKEGLELAKQKLREFHQKYNNLPTCAQFPSISTCCCKGKWKSFGVSSWNDLLLDLFNETNQEQGKWTGFQGLQLAKKVYLNSVRTKEKISFRSAVKRGYWKDYGIFSWDDFRKYATLHE